MSKAKLAAAETSKGTTKEELVSDLRALGVCRGDLLNVKASLSSVGYVQGGAEALLEGLLDSVGAEGTIVTDSFVPAYPLPMSDEDRQKVVTEYTPSYAGALANAMLGHPRVIRSRHPIQKFSAIGRLGADLMQAHGPESAPYDVLRVMAGLGGRNIKIGPDEKVPGVGTTHVAIGLLGLNQDRSPRGVYYRTDEGRIELFERTWAGGCHEGFNNFWPLYYEAGAVEGEGKVGQAPAKITDMSTTLKVELETLERVPGFFLCDDPACRSCRLSWEFSSGNLLSVVLHRGLAEVRRSGLRGIGTTLARIWRNQRFLGRG